MSIEDTIEELTLLLLYLTSWEEKSPFGSAYRSWKGYPFEMLDQLTTAGYISGSRNAKSVYFTEEGAAKAQELQRKYLGTK
ncbi:hypothetical protein CEB3_c02810 [Peptococcaceae bacterium CEB3]|nr:hypothetical protein CEB3_c02810 [Peptococcaceae bacterium CEB3]